MRLLSVKYAEKPQCRSAQEVNIGTIALIAWQTGTWMVNRVIVPPAAAALWSQLPCGAGGMENGRLSTAVEYAVI